MDERVINVAGRYLKDLEKAKAVTQWARENKKTLERHLKGYDELAARLNQVSDNSPLLKVMPKTKKLKGAMKGTLIPTLNEMVDGNFAFGLMEARKPMLHGQKIKTGEINDPSDNDKFYAIGTLSMNTADEALAIGAAGHLAERTFFQWARKQNLIPENGWIKDDWLQALGEGLMLLKAEGKEPHLTQHFVKQNNEGGLGWLNEEKVREFIVKASPLLQ